MSEYTIKLGDTYFTGTITKEAYSSNGNIALCYNEKETEDPITVFTTNLDGLSSDEVAIKDYSENEGCYLQLIAAGIITPAHRWLQSGHVNFPICRCII